VYAAYNFNGHIENEELLKATSSHIHYKSGNIWKTGKCRDFVIEWPSAPFFTATRHNPSMYYINCFLSLKSLVINSVCVDMDLLYPTCNLVTCEKIFWTVYCTVTFINVLISCFFTLLAWLGLCIMFCIRLPYFVTCMSVEFLSVKVFIKQSYLLTYYLLIRLLQVYSNAIFSYSLEAVDKISTDWASTDPSAIAELPVTLCEIRTSIVDAAPRQRGAEK